LGPLLAEKYLHHPAAQFFTFFAFPRQILQEFYHQSIPHQMFTLLTMGYNYDYYRFSHLLKDDQTVTIGKWCIKPIHTPSHSPDHCAYYLPDQKILFSGDIFSVKVYRVFSLLIQTRILSNVW
jgi:glyoxylase-like metal-dependent hydrolase (beta-lactamase superfamily II)